MNQLITNIDTLLLGFVQGSFGGLTPIIQTCWRLMFIIFLAIHGYKTLLSGKFSAPDLVMHCFKIVLVLVLATQWDVFYQFIYRMVTDLPSDISGQIMQAASGSLGAQSQAHDTASANLALARFYDRSLAVCDKLLEGAGWQQLGLYFYAGIVWLGAGAFTGYAMMMILLAKISIAVILAVGPFFILLLVFHDTRKLFEGWLRTLLNYALIPMFVYAVLALLLAITTPTLVYLESHSSVYDQMITAIGPFAITTYIATILLRQVMNIAANITGGVSLSTMGTFGAAVSGARYVGESYAMAGSKTVQGIKTAQSYAAPRIQAGRNMLRQALSGQSGGKDRSSS